MALAREISNKVKVRQCSSQTLIQTRSVDRCCTTALRLTDSHQWHLFIDEFGGRGYVPFETTNIAAADWKLSTNYALPKKPRHGSVIPITAAEKATLLAL